MTDFRTLGSEQTHHGRVRVRVDRVAGPDGATFEREVVEALDSVVVVPVTADGEVVLVRQYRQPAGAALWELPAGLRDVDGETVLQAAARELAEEVGLGGGTLVELGTFWVSPGWTTERATLVLGTGLVPTDAPAGFEPAAEEAAMAVMAVPPATALAMLADGEVTDATTALGLLVAQQHGALP